MPPVIYRRTVRSFLSAGAGAVAFGVLGVLLLLIPSDLYPRPIVLAVGILSIVFAIVAGISWWRLWRRRNRPALVLTEEGLEDRTSLVAAEAIPWSEVRGVRVVRAGLVQLICVDLVDPEGYIARFEGWGAAALRSNLGLRGTPLVLAASGLDRPVEEIARVIEETRARATIHD